MRDPIISYDKKLHQVFASKRVREKELLVLSGIIKGICADSMVNEKEVAELSRWIKGNEFWLNKKPFDVLLFHITEIIKDGFVSQDEIDDLIWIANKISEWNNCGDPLQSLPGFFHGLLADGEISDIEIEKLSHWVEVNDFLAGTFPYDELEALLKDISTNKTVTKDGRDKLIAFIGEFIDFEHSENLSYEHWLELRKQYPIHGILDIDPKIDFKGKTFCCTGESKCAKRSEIREQIISHGGEFKDTVTKDTNYLVIGAKGSLCWAFLKYGQKIEKAIELRKEGRDILIVLEDDFWRAIESAPVVTKDDDYAAGLWREILELGIPRVGVSMARDLAARFKTMEALKSASEEELFSVPKIGEMTAETIIEFFEEERYEKKPTRTAKNSTPTSISGTFSGKTFVITGTLSTISREGAKKLLLSEGARITSSVSSKTDFLIAGADAGLKLEKAIALGVRIIDEDEMLNMLGISRLKRYS